MLIVAWTGELGMNDGSMRYAEVPIQVRVDRT